MRNGVVTLILGLGVLAAAPAPAQTALGTLRGVVVDEQGGALPGVTVTLRHIDTNTIQTTVTGGDGCTVLDSDSGRWRRCTAIANRSGS